MTSKTLFPLLTAAFFAAVSSVFCNAQQPNIVLLLADDAGYHDFGFQCDEPALRQATPNIDSIATEGAKFTQAYVSANVCAPSRAGLLTGEYQQRYGFRDNLPGHWGKRPDPRWLTEEWRQFGLEPGRKTIADHLKPLGYYCGIVGKWHLGYTDEFAPMSRGFDYFNGLRSGSRSFFPVNAFGQLIPEQYEQLEENGRFLPESEIRHVTETQADAAIGFIDEAEERNEPFFLFLSFTAPHTPLQPDEQSLAIAKNLFPEADGKRLAYLGLVIGMDRAVGRVLDRLERSQLDQNTLIVFMSDNGGSRKNASNNSPLSGHKWSPMEGGYRVPMALKWRGVVKSGSMISEPVISLDLLPTFVTAAGGTIPQNLDGKALQPVLAGNSLGDRTFYWWDYNSEGVTSTILRHPWKLIQQESSTRDEPAISQNKPWLFHLGNDLSETQNMAETHPELVRQLKNHLMRWRNQLPKPNW
ncbi:sulfatase-like hydrolase/transferase [Rhodopirellula sp. SWK7]|uniref:sulfatase-like hydrolase/transferase n=1 Tax=Rhodopirellula sp. SWK7 TaxID=595460 RepID=UPI0002BE43B6|nr:sulfatase-like hydrolase/transferase [Rhodopirellula sp. SWK7]EMI43685.1 N-acetylgalactosamine 6-sulfate sulfatase (GALNS) [Rhodopirellula sp. SWK7]